MLECFINARINDCKWTFMKVQQSFNTGMNRWNNFIKLGYIRYQDNQRFSIVSALDFIYFFDCVFICGIATNPPDRVCWVQQDASIPENIYGLFNNLFQGFFVHRGDIRENSLKSNLYVTH